MYCRWGLAGYEIRFRNSSVYALQKDYADMGRDEPTHVIHYSSIIHRPVNINIL